MQYRTGTISVTNGSATVTGTGTEFLANVSIGDDMVARDPALLPNEIASYIVGGVVSDTQITLTAPYGAASATDIPYVAHKDYLANGNPKWANGDVEFAAIQNRYNSITLSATTLSSGAFTEVGTASTLDHGTAAGQVPKNSDLPDFGTAAAFDEGTTTGKLIKNDNVLAASSNFLNYDASSTANAIVLTTPYATKRTALIVGEELSFWATATNTGAATITIDSIGTFDAKTTMSGNPKSGYIRPNEPTCFYYDGVNLVVKPPSNFTYSKSETSLVPGAGTLNLSRNGHTVTATWSQASVNLFSVTAGTALFNIPDGYRPINNHEAATNTKGTSTSNGSTILATSDGLMIAYLYAENLTLNYSFSATWLTTNDYPAQ